MLDCINIFSTRQSRTQFDVKHLVNNGMCKCNIGNTYINRLVPIHQQLRLVSNDSKPTVGLMVNQRSLSLLVEFSQNFSKSSKSTRKENSPLHILKTGQQTIVYQKWNYRLNMRQKTGIHHFHCLLTRRRWVNPHDQNSLQNNQLHPKKPTLCASNSKEILQFKVSQSLTINKHYKEKKPSLVFILPSKRCLKWIECAKWA